MTPAVIRPLTPAAHSRAVRQLYDRAADYVELETGGPPSPETVEEFFSGFPPGGDLSRSHKLGLFAGNGELAAVADLGFGFPDPDDAYIGLLLVARDRRGTGLGPVLLDHIKGLARAAGAPRLLLAVLDANPRGRAYWEREGFRVVSISPPTRSGSRIHVRHRMELRL